MPPRRAIFVLLLIWSFGPTPSHAQQRCPVERPTHHHRTSLRTRAIISALMPTIYVDLRRQRQRDDDRRVARLGVAPPETARPGPGRIVLQNDRSARWELGAMWRPLAFVRRLDDLGSETVEAESPPEMIRQACAALREGSGSGDASLEEAIDRELAERRIDARDLLFAP